MGCCQSNSTYVPPPPPDVAHIDLETGEVVVKKQKVNQYGQYVQDTSSNDSSETKAPEKVLDKDEIWFKDMIPISRRPYLHSQQQFNGNGEKADGVKPEPVEVMKIGAKVVCVDDSNELFGGIITHKNYIPGQLTQFGKFSDRIQFTLAVVSTDGSGFYIASRNVYVSESIKPMHLDDLNIRPLESCDESILEVLKRRGKKFRDCALGHNFMEYDGEVFGVDKGKSTLSGSQAEPNFDHLITMYTAGRAMVDITEFNKTFPSCQVFKNVNQNQGQYLGGSHNRKKNTIRTARMRLKPQKTAAHIADSLLFLCGSWLPAYSFDIKQWALFNVDKLRDVQWESKAWDMLVMAPKRKAMIAAMVKQVPVVAMERSHVISENDGVESKSNEKEVDEVDNETIETGTVVKASREFSDVISGKGGGCIFLLHGKPGVGKTLTAEAVSELLHMPLYSVSMAEISTDYKELERSLKRILYLAAKWNTIVLLDEADIFLEKRTANNIQRCALVGIFLRLLEYYQGILFLTTNRVREFDEAFHSRINMCIAYPDLDQNTRKMVWKNMLKSAGVSVSSQLLTDDTLTKLSKENFNGRQIRNAVQLSLALQKDRNDHILSPEHLHHVVAGLLRASRELEDALHAN